MVRRTQARQYIQQDLADELRRLIATKSPKAPLFRMPHATDMAKMLCEDVEAARSAWIKAANRQPGEYARREQSDFLAAVYHEGEKLDFHALRHTCGAWLAMTGAHPNDMKAIMRHSSITLTMDTYGHLFPGQEANTIARLPNMFSRPAACPVSGQTPPGFILRLSNGPRDVIREREPR